MKIDNLRQGLVSQWLLQVPHFHRWRRSRCVTPDEDLRDELEVHLAILKREGAIDAWHDRKIAAGDVLNEAISDKLETAEVILLLISPDFLASRYCYEVEFQRTLDRHEQGLTRAIAVILRPCEWQQTRISKFMVTPRDGKPVTKWPDKDDAFLNVVQQIRAALPKTTKTAASVPAHAHSAPVVALPRSSNLRLRSQFTEADRDQFGDDAFEFMARFFEGSLDELMQRNDGIEARFRRIDARTFTAVIYRNGKAEGRCAIRHGGSRGLGGGITFSNDDRDSSTSYNESLSIGTTDQALFLKPMGMRIGMSGINRDSHLGFEGAAEYYWSLLIEPLQR